MMPNVIFRRVSNGLRISILMMLLAAAVFAQSDIKASLFEEADGALQTALKAHADVLAPKNFAEGLKFYREAEEQFERGKNLEDIRKKLKACEAYLRKAMEATKLAEVTLVSSFKARSDAQNAESANYAAESWNKAEAKFREAAGSLEDGDVNGARKKGGEAEGLYRQAELAAIKSNYLQETWSLLEQAEKLKVKDSAPKTLQRARELVQQAEKELNENRYDTDVARNLAQQARYEASHAIYLHNLFLRMKEQKLTNEDLVLGSEAPLQKIAAAIDVVAEFDNGFGDVTGQIIRYIQTYQDSVARLSQTVQDQKQQIAQYQEQVGGLAEEQTLLKQQMEAVAKVREQFQTVERMFNREEARVFREGSDVIMRLVGLNFASGKAVIEPQYFSLLSKVQTAVKTFPECSVTIEGHTDSHGGDAANLRLSEERAEAVRQYLLANMPDLLPAQVASVGYGESKPIANNETAEGRAKNRRIDLVIHPRLPEIVSETP